MFFHFEYLSISILFSLHTRVPHIATFDQWLGDGCYALAASYGGLEGVQHMLAVVYRDAANAEHGQNANWASSSPAQQRDALQVCSAALL
jgi:hypothetical protein